MVQFKNRYMVMEVFIDPNRELGGHEPIVISHFNLAKAIKDSILLNFGECSLTLSLCSFQKIWTAITLVRSVGKCPITFNLLDLMKFEAYKLSSGGCVKPEITHIVESCFEKLKNLES
ncbi:hypothetical protein J5N97_008420 [Dioscorea zingiberensis]|uniref:Uncharacterized protein n=1 Tax=Dioscorea zingiberensis TaxID=325984 RepID=A0A9D5CUN5_9LILI|nr:hypothetical protein J5N97_008420 [Dioscorea zingiberensis]